MHKAYQSTLPASNRLLKKKWDDKYYSEHRILVRDARPSVDTRPPRTYMHLHMKLKKLQLQEERTATIERDNRILLEKMSNTMRTTGNIDNRNTYEGRSLNQEKRRRELLRVSQENGTLAKRIIERQPVMGRKDWEGSSQQNNVYLNNIAKYHVDWHLPKTPNRQIHSGKPSSKDATSAPQEDKKVDEVPSTANETSTTKSGKNKAKK